MKLYVLSVSLVKYDVGQTTYSLMQGYRVSESENEAKGSFMERALEEKPGFAISQLLCMVVSDETIAMVTAAPEAPK